MNSHRWHPSPPPSPSQPAPWYSQIINGLQLYSEITTWLIAPLHKVDSNPNFTWVFCRARASTATRLSSLQARGWNTLPRFLGTVDLVFCPVTSIQGVPGLVPLLILVLLGKLLVTLDDVGALGFASSLYSEKLKDIFTKPFSSWILPWTSQPPWPWGRGSLPAISSSSGSSPDCRQFAFHSYPGFWKSYRWHKNRRRRRWSENWIAKQVRHCRRHDQGQPFFFLYNHRCALPLSRSKLFYCSSCDSLHEDCMCI